VFGIDFGAPELCSVSGGFLQQGLGLFADTAGEPTAATARGARTGRGGFAERGIDDLVGIGTMDGASSPMRKKSLPRKSSNSPLREPKRLPAVRRCAFAGAPVGDSDRHTTAWCCGDH